MSTPRQNSTIWKEAELRLMGTAATVLMPIGMGGECLAVAVIGKAIDGAPFARVATSRPLTGLPNDLGAACFTFGSLVVADYLATANEDSALDAWRPPVQGLSIGRVFEVEAFDVTSLAEHAIAMCALHEPAPSEVEAELDATPRNTDEGRFLETVRESILRSRPTLAAGFNKSFSLTGARIRSKIDYVGSRYATCYASISPKRSASALSKNAFAALWRLARARDSFGAAAPARFELTAWTPPLGLPIFTEHEYETVGLAINELAEQARRESMFVYSAHTSDEASNRLLEFEAGARSS